MAFIPTVVMHASFIKHTMQIFKFSYGIERELVLFDLKFEPGLCHENRLWAVCFSQFYIDFTSTLDYFGIENLFQSCFKAMVR